MKIYTFEVELGSPAYCDEPGIAHKILLNGHTVAEYEVGWNENKDDVIQYFAHTLSKALEKYS